MIRSCANPVSVSCNLFTGCEELEWHPDTLQILKSRDTVITSACTLLLHPATKATRAQRGFRENPAPEQQTAPQSKAGAGHRQLTEKGCCAKVKLKFTLKYETCCCTSYFGFSGMSLPAMEIRNHPWLWLGREGASWFGGSISNPGLILDLSVVWYCKIT